jgi:hypothetical protein
VQVTDSKDLRFGGIGKSSQQAKNTRLNNHAALYLTLSLGGELQSLGEAVYRRSVPESENKARKL